MNKRFWTLRCWAVPVAALLPLLPLMDFSADQIPLWFKGTSFISLVAQFLTALFSGLADALIVALLGGGTAA